MRTLPALAIERNQRAEERNQRAEISVAGMIRRQDNTKLARTGPRQGRAMRGD